MKINKKGFTLIEILIYVVILAIVGGASTSLLLNVSRIHQRESAEVELTTQLDFAMGTISRLIKESSNVEIETGIATSTLKLRMKDASQDPTCISLDSGKIKLSQGPADNPNNCTSTTSNLTNDQVIVNTLDFKKFSQYPGRDVTSIDIQMTYNTQNPLFQLQRSLTSAIARVSAATFDSDVLPGGAYNYSLGQAGTPWLKVITADGGADAPSYTFGNDTDLGVFRAGTDILGFSTAGSERMRIDASGNVGIGTTEPSGLLDVGGGKLVVLSGGNVGIGTADPGATLEVKGTMKVFGAWETKANGTVYQAETDGFVCAHGSVSSGRLVICGYTDSNNPPTTLKAQQGFDPSSGAHHESIMMPVRKGDYWKTTGEEVTVYWIPLGT